MCWLFCSFSSLSNAKKTTKKTTLDYEDFNMNGPIFFSQASIRLRRSQSEFDCCRWRSGVVCSLPDKAGNLEEILHCADLATRLIISMCLIHLTFTQMANLFASVWPITHSNSIELDQYFFFTHRLLLTIISTIENKKQTPTHFRCSFFSDNMW